MTTELQAIAVSPKQAAALLNISRATVFRLIRDGKIRTTKVGHRTLINPQHLKRLAPA